MRSPYRTKRSIFSISNLRATKFWMILCRSASEFIRMRRKELPFNLWSLPFAAIPSADVCLLIFPSSCSITAANDSTSASLARISCAVPAFAFRSKEFLARARFCFFVFRTSRFSRMSAMVRSAIFLLCPEMKSVDSTADEGSHYERGEEASCASICAFHSRSRVARGTPDCWSLSPASVLRSRALYHFLCIQLPSSSRFCFSNQWS